MIDFNHLAEKHETATSIEGKTYVAFQIDSFLGVPPRVCFLRKQAYEAYLRREIISLHPSSL